MPLSVSLTVATISLEMGVGGGGGWGGKKRLNDRGRVIEGGGGSYSREGTYSGKYGSYDSSKFPLEW